MLRNGANVPRNAAPEYKPGRCSAEQSARRDSSQRLRKRNATPLRNTSLRKIVLEKKNVKEIGSLVLGVL